jgi:endonuclease YncB( thermonuclease family)
LSYLKDKNYTFKPYYPAVYMQIKSIFILVLFLISGFFYYNLTDSKTTISTIEVARVIDGDTIESITLQKVRLKGINTPERGMLGSSEAVDFLEEKILNKAVEIVSFGADKYGRTLGFLILDNKNINAEILKRGLASLYYYEKDEFYNEMENAEEFARLNGLGIWKKSSNMPCIELIELRFKEPEKLILENSCDTDIAVVIKDDATHIYKETLEANDIFEMETSHIWNDAGDTVYVSDEEGLLIFYRYS